MFSEYYFVQTIKLNVKNFIFKTVTDWLWYSGAGPIHTIIRAETDQLSLMRFYVRL